MIDYPRISPGQYLIGETFSVADGYLFTVLSWSEPVGLDPFQWSCLEAYVAQVTQRPKVMQALR